LLRELNEKLPTQHKRSKYSYSYSYDKNENTSENESARVCIQAMWQKQNNQTGSLSSEFRAGPLPLLL